MKYLFSILLITIAFISNPTQAATDPEPIPQTAVCQAITSCGSYSISCITYGDGCTWFVDPYVSVQCTGFNYYGRWVNFYYTC